MAWMMKKLFQLKYFFPVMTILCCAFFFRWSIQNDKQMQTPHENEMISSCSLGMKNFSTVEFANNRPLSRLKADELTIGPRSYFAFNIRPLNEANLKNAKLETYYYSNESQKERDTWSINGSRDILLGTSSLKSLRSAGIITRCRISGFSWEIYQDGQAGMVVNATNALVNIRKHEIKLSEVRIYDRKSQKFIAAHSATWKDKQKSFLIPGNYIVMTSKGYASGSGVRLDLNFFATPLS
jgi:hypothetical protein